VTEEEALAQFCTSDGKTIADCSRASDVLLVFLRHEGCTFCREALADLAEKRSALEAAGTRLVIVHMSSDSGFRVLTDKYGLPDVPLVSDPERTLYQALGLRRASWWEMLSPHIWWKGFRAALIAGHGFGGIRGDAFQMPGIFLIREGRVIAKHLHRDASERPDYLEVCALPTRL